MTSPSPWGQPTPPPLPPNPPVQQWSQPTPAHFTVRPVRPSWIWPVTILVAVMILAAAGIAGVIILHGGDTTSTTPNRTASVPSSKNDVFEMLWEEQSPSEQRDICNAMVLYGIDGDYKLSLSLVEWLKDNKCGG